MKSMLVIGMGKFGIFLATKLQELGNEVMVIDIDEKVIDGIASTFANAQIGDCTRREVLSSLGVDDFDVCFVSIDENFQSSLEITALLHELGAKRIVSKSSRTMQEKFLRQNGASEVIFPDKDIAESLAVKYCDDNIRDYLKISGDLSLFELNIPSKWVGKTIAQIDVRRKHLINILYVKNGETLTAPTADYIFCQSDHVLVIGKKDDILRFSKSYE